MRQWPNHQRSAHWLRRAVTSAEAFLLLAGSPETLKAWPAAERSRALDQLSDFLQEALAVARGDTLHDPAWRTSFLWAAEAMGGTASQSTEGFCQILQGFIRTLRRLKEGPERPAPEDQQALGDFLGSLVHIAKEEEESAAQGEPYDRWSKRVLQASLP